MTAFIDAFLAFLDTDSGMYLSQVVPPTLSAIALGWAVMRYSGKS